MLPRRWRNSSRLEMKSFPNLRVGLIHGRLSLDEKDAAMRAFSHHETDMLVATSVIEVGVDVPNSTVIVIEGADRFGLAQLHQFRGRVGAGRAPILLHSAG
jgi:ATP-dependent DNA helicase RecG